jgi:hypothetical protein
MHVTNTDDSGMIADRIPAMVKTEDPVSVKIIMAKSIKNDFMSCQSHIIITKVWPHKEYTISRRELYGYSVSRNKYFSFQIRLSHALLLYPFVTYLLTSSYFV